MMKRIFTLALIGLLAAGAALAQKRAFTIEDVYRLTTASGPVVSPDGTLVAYTVSHSDLKNTKSYSDVWVMRADGTDTVAVTTDGLSYSPVWSQDGKCLYYTSARSGKPQVYSQGTGFGSARQLTDYALGVNAPVVSPNGKYVAFVANIYPDLGADGEANLAAIRRSKEGPLQAHIADSLLYRHWTEYADQRLDHIIMCDVAAGTYTDITPGTYTAPVFMLGGIGFNFSPDSRELCYMSNHDQHQEASTNSDLWLVPVTGGEARCITTDNKAWDGSPVYSPDGRYIAYRTQRVPGYEADRFILALYDRKTGEKTILSENFDNWVEDFKWHGNDEIYFIGQNRGYQPLYKVNLKNRKITEVLSKRAIYSFDVDARGNIYYDYSTTGKPSAIYKADAKKLQEQQLTFYNRDFENEVDIRPSEQMWVRGAKGDSVHVFIVKPHDFDPDKKYPLVINVHGGPQMQWMDSYRADWQVYPGAGYVVAYPNPHGSTGYGQQYTRDISGDWGGKPFTDVMLVTDALAKLSYVDSTRMGAMGWSYGGYFMNWLQGHTKRFKCLVSMMGLYELPSMWGATEELWFPNFDLQGQPWNSDLYRTMSPSSYVKNFSTPTLIITGERDYRVSYTQALQYFTTLQTLGIPSRLIVWPNDGHWPDNLRSMPLYYNSHLEWFHTYLGGAPAPWDSHRMVREARVPLDD